VSNNMHYVPAWHKPNAAAGPLLTTIHPHKELLSTLTIDMLCTLVLVPDVAPGFSSGAALVSRARRRAATSSSSAPVRSASKNCICRQQSAGQPVGHERPSALQVHLSEGVQKVQGVHNSMTYVAQDVTLHAEIPWSVGLI
jgi:hypothetical protein